jgi:UDP-N-acetylglucosamine 2-epimerase (non-hydrolysing)
VSRALVPLLSGLSPDLAIVQGDTSSALGGALAARMAGVPIAHVEAGLRSHDRRRPWPEEEFRVAIDSDSAVLFAPTELSACNLRRERLRGRIHVTGNSGIDAVLSAGGSSEPAAAGRQPRLLVTCHRRENWGDGIGAIAQALREIAQGELARVDVILHPNPNVSLQVRQMLLGQSGIAFRQACPHREAIAQMLRCDLVLSDSGGLQEEAAALGVPLLVLREKTERPEAIACGTAELVGTDPARIVAAVRRRLATATAASKALPFGDGRAGERIAAIVAEWLAERNSTAEWLASEPGALFPKSGRRANA